MRLASSGKTMTLISEFENKPRPAAPQEIPKPDPAALDNAREEGFLLGRESGLKEIDPVRIFLKTCAETLQSETRKAADHLDSAAIKLALEIAAKLLERELKNPDTFRDAVTRLLRLAPHDNKSVLRVHPSMCHMLKSRDATTGAIDLLTGATLVEDDTIEPGGCVVQTPQGSWDAQISARLALIARELGDETSK